MKGTLVLVSPGEGRLENRQVTIPMNIHWLFIIDGVPLSSFTKSLILQPKNKDDITIIPADHQCPWQVINDIWSISKETQTIVVIAPNRDIFRIAEAIAPIGCRLMLSTYRPGGDISVSINGRDRFEIIAS